MINMIYFDIFREKKLSNFWDLKKSSFDFRWLWPLSRAAKPFLSCKGCIEKDKNSNFVKFEKFLDKKVTKCQQFLFKKMSNYLHSHSYSCTKTSGMDTG